MARYYFHVQDGARLTPDEEGLELDSLAAVEYEATHTAAEMGRDRLLKGQSGDIVVEVRDELSRRVLTVTASMRVERLALLPQPSTPWGA